jgi:prepilin signal peptidase PulO-like enzyme (type II secretory pathway)
VYDITAADLTKEQILAYSLYMFEMEVNNGGLCQFFVNSSRECAPFISEALEAIGATELINMLTGILPGAIFCLLARITGKVGYGDGVLLMELGICFGYHRIMLLLCVSLMLMAILSILLLAMHKVKKDTKVPFFPMLAIVFLFIEVLGG